MKKHYREENNCLNCGTTLEGPFCHKCGQENLQIKENFGHMMNHAISDYFHFDQKFFHTLKPLFFKPGMLTNEYMAGRRVQYLHPVKMYIFISLVYFLLAFQQNNNLVKVNPKQFNKAAIEAVEKNTDLTAQQKKEAIKEIQDDAAHITSYKVEKKLPKSDIHSKLTATTYDTTYAQYLVSQSKLPENERDGWMKNYYNKKAFALNDPKLNKKELIGEGLKHNFPKMMFLLLPLFALILKIAFWRNKKFYVEHLIYTFHLHCFIFLFLTIIMILETVIPIGWTTFKDWLLFAVALAIIWYIYRSLRVVYHRSRWRTISKMIGMTGVYLVVFSVCLLLLVVVTTLTVI